jgi:hypothetical protein
LGPQERRSQERPLVDLQETALAPQHMSISNPHQPHNQARNVPCLLRRTSWQQEHTGHLLANRSSTLYTTIQSELE